MGPFVRGRLERLPWQPEVTAIRPMASRRSRTGSIIGHLGMMATHPTQPWRRGITCECGWATWDQRRMRANWRRHLDQFRPRVENF